MNTLLIILGTILAYQLLVVPILNKTVKYILTEDAFEIVGVLKIFYDDIIDIRKAKMFEGIIGIYIHPNWQNGIYKERVIIRRRNGFNKYIIITPDSPDQFIADVKPGMGQVSRNN